MPLLHGPRVVLTGAGGGLGRAFGQQLAAREARLLLSDVRLEEALAAAAALPAGSAHRGSMSRVWWPPGMSARRAWTGQGCCSVPLPWRSSSAPAAAQAPRRGLQGWSRPRDAVMRGWGVSSRHRLLPEGGGSWFVRRLERPGAREGAAP